MKFTIETVAKLTGIPATTLRNWEKRYGFPTPQRGDSGYRFYCANDLEFLKKVKAWVATGHNLSDIGTYYHDFKGNTVEAQNEPSSLLDDVEYRVDLLFESLTQFDMTSAQTHYVLLNAKLSPEHLFDRVFERVLRRLGREWSEGKISVAQEHFASSFIRLRLAAFLAMDLPTSHSLKIIAATLSSERHEGGLLLVSSHLKYRGYNVNYFGPDLPIGELQGLIQGLKPDCVMLSYVTSERVKEDWEQILKIKCSVVLGGLAFAVENQKLTDLAEAAPRNIFVCRQTVGSAAASFIEMVTQSQRR